MRVLLVSPSVPPDASGNAATAGRLAAALAPLGVDVTLARAADPGGPEGLARLLEERPADLLHVHHLVKAGRVLLPAMAWPPVVASVGGTDLLPLSPRDEGIRNAVLALARRVLVPTEEACRLLAGEDPERRRRCRLVPRGARLGAAPFDLRAEAGAAPGDILFFLPAGFRVVKRNAFAMAGLAALKAKGLPVRLAAAGPVLEAAAAEAFDQAARGRDWIRHLPPIPPEAMGAALAGADVVLNTSSHEGMSNAVLEGMLAGRAVLASDIPGNRAVIRDGQTGLLFSSEADFSAKAERLARAPELRARLGQAARAEALARFSPEAEAVSVLAAYREALEEAIVRV